MSEKLFSSETLLKCALFQIHPKIHRCTNTLQFQRQTIDSTLKFDQKNFERYLWKAFDEITLTREKCH